LEKKKQRIQIPFFKYFFKDLYGWRYFCPEKLVELVSYVGITVGLV